MTRLALNLRAHLLRSPNGLRAVFRELYKKVTVKSHLTDRVLTGDHKTNREKRWECHPSSVHFATRKDCLSIEAKLMQSTLMFEGFPDAERTRYQRIGLLPPDWSVARCPITYEPLSFRLLRAQLDDPDHGRSAFQVGHLNPLKAANDEVISGHTADNVSWISADGNRIQGHRGLYETRQLIGRIYQNYSNEGILLTDSSTIPRS